VFGGDGSESGGLLLFYVKVRCLECIGLLLRLSK
jgi:hypothetical protein